MTTPRAASLTTAIGLALLCVSGAGANQSPYPPAFIEPLEGAVLSASDPHFNLYPFSDPDSGDVAVSSDFEVWDDTLDVRVWADLGETGSLSHVHIGDGIFEGPLSGESRFTPDRDYRIRARYRDSSGAPNDVGAWSAWIHFHTAPLIVPFPLLIDDIFGDSYLAWTNEAGSPIDVPSGSTPATLEVTGRGQRLLLLEGSASDPYAATNPGSIGQEGPVALLFRAGSLAWNLPQSRLRFHDQTGGSRELYLPNLSLAAGDSAFLWVSEFGATYHGAFADSLPHFESLARDVAVPWFPSRAGVVIEKVVTGLYLPVNLAFLPDPGPDSLDACFYVTELYGKVKVITRNYTVLPLLTDLLNFPPTGEFAGSGEMGVTGITYYPPERALYVSYAYQENDAFFGRVIRAWLSPDRKSVAAVDTVFQGVPIGYSHQIHSVNVGPDGYLYVNTGDGLVSTSAQDVGDLRGKILRMTRNGGLPPDNPFPGSYTYALGFRNPVGGTFRPGTGDLFICDNGASTDDRIVKVAGGSNYGWCCTTTAGALQLFNPTVAPVAVSFPPNGILPPEYAGRLFMTLSGPTYDKGLTDRGKAIWSFALDDTGAIVQSEPFIHYVGSGFATACGLAAGVDGLYFTDLYGDAGFNELGITSASIYRISAGTVAAAPEPAPAPAALRLTISPNPIRRATRITFDLPAAGPGDLAVFDVQGRLVRRLARRDWPAGASSLEWDGRDDRGRPVPGGIYFVRLEVGGQRAAGRVIVTR